MSPSDKICWFVSVFVLGILGMVALDHPPSTRAVEQTRPIAQAPSLPPAIVQPPSLPPPSVQPPQADADTVGCQVCVPKALRIFNKSGSQCVWCSAEMLGRLHQVKGLVGLTDRYKHATGPGEFGSVMTQRGVKFKQVNGRDLDFIQEWVADKKMGVGIGVNHNHVILLCHFERDKLVKVIDNSDRSLSVQTWDWSKFQRHFSGWVFVILPDAAQVEASWSNAVPDDGHLYSGSFASKCVAGEAVTYNVWAWRHNPDDHDRTSTEIHFRQTAPTVYQVDEGDAR